MNIELTIPVSPFGRDSAYRKNTSFKSADSEDEEEDGDDAMNFNCWGGCDI
jgi:hypothetical protein